MSNKNGMTFEDAVEYVLTTKKTVFNFSSEKKKGLIIGGYIYVIGFEDIDPEEEINNEKDFIKIDYVGGKFNDFSGEDDCFNYDDVGEDAKNMQYNVAASDFSTSDLYYELQILLKILSGVSRTDAMNKFTCPECDQILYRTGRVGKCKKCK